MGVSCSSASTDNSQLGSPTGVNGGAAVPPARSQRFKNRYPKRGALLQVEPTLGVVLSGGGWRAMESGAYFMDVLRQHELLSLTSVVAGLSGGCWTTVLGALSGERNILYSDTDTINSWTDSCNTKTNDMVKTLTHMLSADNAARARRESVERGGSQRAWYSVTSVGLEIMKAFDEQLATIGDGLTINPDEAYLYNYMCMIGYQFYGKGWDQVKLRQASTRNLPLFLIAAVNENEHWYELDGVGSGGLRKMALHSDLHDDAIVRHDLSSLRIVFDGQRCEELTSSSVMAMCGSAMYGTISTAFELTGLDRDGFRGHLTVADTKSPVDVLFDAGTSCNVPLQLVRTRCKVAFVVDSSADDKAAEQLSTSVKKGYYHLYIPPTTTKERFIDEHVNREWPPGDDVRIFFPDSNHSKSLWGVDSENGLEEPILIYVRALREIATFRMDRTKEEIVEAKNIMAVRAKMAIRALEFLMVQDTIPAKGFWNVHDFAPEEAAKGPAVNSLMALASSTSRSLGPQPANIVAWNAFKTPNQIQQCFESAYIKKFGGDAAVLRKEALQILGSVSDDLHEDELSLSSNLNYQAYIWASAICDSTQELIQKHTDEDTIDETLQQMFANQTLSLTTRTPHEASHFFHMVALFVIHDDNVAESARQLIAVSLQLYLVAKHDMPPSDVDAATMRVLLDVINASL